MMWVNGTEFFGFLVGDQIAYVDFARQAAGLAGIPAATQFLDVAGAQLAMGLPQPEGIAKYFAGGRVFAGLNGRADGCSHGLGQGDGDAFDICHDGCAPTMNKYAIEHKYSQRAAIQAALIKFPARAHATE
jgi:hypothetical protein